MSSLPISTGKHNQITYRYIVGLFFLGYLLLGSILFWDYGLSYDQVASRYYGWANVKYVFQGDKQLLHFVERYHGPVFEIWLVMFEILFRLCDPKRRYMDISRNIFLVRYFITFLTFYLSVLCFYRLCKKRFQSWKIGLLGSLFLIVSPRIFAHSFYNSKDLPFLSLFIISIYTLTCYVEQQNLRNACRHGFISAVLIDIRILGVILPFFTALFIGSEIVVQASSRKMLSLRGKFLICYLLVVMICTILFFPLLWDNPLQRFFEVFRAMKQFGWEGSVLYQGQYITATQLPWHYIPVWIMITTPLLYLFTGAVGIGRSVFTLFTSLRTGKCDRPQRYDMLFLLWFFQPIATIILFRSVVYDEWRHLFFIYPALLTFSLHGVVWGYTALQHNLPGRLKQLTLLLLIFLILAGLFEPAYFMVKYHPYQNVYFNRLAGKNMATIKRNFELDYWGLSYRKALEYIVQHDDRDTIHVYVALGSGKANAEMLRPEEKKRLVYVDSPEDADYFLSNYRYHKHDYPYSHEFYRVEIDGAKIMVVYDLRGEA